MKNEENKIWMFVIILGLSVLSTFLLTLVMTQQAYFNTKMEAYNNISKIKSQMQNELVIAQQNMAASLFSRIKESTNNCSVYNMTFNNSYLPIMSYSCYVDVSNRIYRNAYLSGYQLAVSQLLNETKNCTPVPISLGAEKVYVVNYNCFKRKIQ